jgi:hypothetical protein
VGKVRPHSINRRRDGVVGFPHARSSGFVRS